MKQYQSASKFISLVLRHRPEIIGVRLEYHGAWVPVKAVLRGAKLTMEELELIVESDAKGRYSFNEDKTKIRANQGHSVEVDLGLAPAQPPEKLYHGTVGRFLGGIQKEGLRAGERQFVHLSADVETALSVGRRRGKPVVIQIAAGRMYEDGYQFFLSANGVWMTKEAPAAYLKI